MELMTKKNWLTQIYESSVPLRRLSEQKLPTGISSGCLVDYGGKRLLLSVEHATGDQQNWAIEIRYEKNKGTKCYQLGAMNFLLIGTISTGEFKDIDFSYVEVPNDLLAYRQELDQEGNVKNEAQVHVFDLVFELEPSKEEKYGFSGHVKPSLEQHTSQTYLGTEFKVYSDLTFVRKKDDYYVFKLPMKHPGHDDFRGCSGVPVIDTKGNVIALVCHGYEEADEIYAVSIKDYKIPIDILVGKIK
jgi:hypothetical protein